MARLLALSLVLGASASDEGPVEDTEKVLYLGDPQIGFGNNGWEMDVSRFRAAAGVAAGADAVLIAGDLVNTWNDDTQMSGFDEVWPSEFEPRLVHLIPGNHDVDSSADDSSKFMKQLNHFRTKYGADYHSFETKYATFIMINSEALILPHLGLDGKQPSADVENEVETQWGWFETALEGARNRTAHTIVVSHHPPFLETADEDHVYWNWPLEDRQRLLALLSKFGVKHVLSGHTHTTTAVTADGLSIYTIAGTARAFDSYGCGYRMLTISPTTVSQEYVRVDQGDPSLKECTKKAAQSDLTLV